MRHAKRFSRVVMAAAALSLLAGGLPWVTQAAPMGAAGFAMAGDNYSTPLIIIRFNQRRVYFEQSLYSVVSKALEAKSSVMFDVVSMVPGYEGGEPSGRQQQMAEANLSKVVASLTQMGVPDSRITVSRRNNPSIDSSEVHIFVH